MIISLSQKGLSFKGAYLYLMHDVKASTRERVDWTQTENMLTQDPDKSWKVMAYTALNQDRLKEASGMSRAGRKTERPALTFSLAWHPEQSPDRDEMLATARRAIDAIGLSEHEALLVAHRDTPHKHVHVLINRIHPTTGRAATLSHSKRKLSALSHQLELEGGKVYCQQRKDNLEMQKEGISTRYRDPAIQNAWNLSNNGEEFMDELASKHYQLARGEKRLLVVDPYGKIVNPIRHIEGVRTKEFREKLTDIKTSGLREVDELAKEVREHAESQSEQGKHYKKEASKALNNMQTRHYDEYGELSGKLQRRIIQEKEKMADFYKLEKSEETVRDLERKCEKPRWWRRVTGLAHRDRRRLQASKLNLANGKQRYMERISTIENEAQDEIADLRAKQDKERAELLEQIAEQKPLRQAPPIEIRKDNVLVRDFSENRRRAAPRPSM